MNDYQRSLYDQRIFIERLTAGMHQAVYRNPADNTLQAWRVFMEVGGYPVIDQYIPGAECVHSKS